MRYSAGVDVGSTQTKAVIIDEDRNIVGRSLIDTGADVVKVFPAGVGGELVGKKLIADRDFKTITKNARDFIQIVREARQS